MNLKVFSLTLFLLLIATGSQHALARANVNVNAEADTAAAARSDDARRLVREGLALLKSGDADAALAKFRDAQVELPESHRLHYNVGLALYRAERYDEAAKAFTLAAVSADREIEKRARLQIGNCSIKAGRYEEALDALNRALEIDGNYAEARANREWVIRKMAELARKKMEQQEKQEQERRFIEKLQEIVGRQTQAHLALRAGMRRRELDLRPTRVERLDEVLNAPLTAKIEDAEALSEEEELALFSNLGGAQKELQELLSALIQEGKQRVDAARAAQANSGGAAGSPPPAAGASPMAMPADPDAAKIAQALPFLEGAKPSLDRALELADEESWNLHAPQEEGLIQLLRALDALLDELTLIIQDELQLLKDTLRLEKSAEGDAAEETRNRALELGTRQAELRDRTQAVAKAIESQVQSVSTGAGTPVGQDPEEAAKRLRSALGHLVGATGHMEEASSFLAQASAKDASEEEKLALEELVKARAALQPPQEKSGEQGDKGDEKEEKKDPSDDGEGDDQKKEKGEEKDDGSKGNEGEQGEDGADEEGGGDGEEKDREQKEGKSGKMSPEQAKQMLQRAEQRERDRRAENKEKGRRARAGGRGGVKDW